MLIPHKSSIRTRPSDTYLVQAMVSEALLKKLEIVDILVLLLRVELDLAHLNVV